MGINFLTPELMWSIKHLIINQVKWFRKLSTTLLVLASTIIFAATFSFLFLSKALWTELRILRLTIGHRIDD